MGTLVVILDGLEFFLTGYSAFLDGDGDGEGDEPVLQISAESWTCLGAKDEDDLDSFVSFGLASSYFRAFFHSAPSFFYFSLFCIITVRSA